MLIKGRIKQLRKTEMLTQNNFAKILGITRGYVAQLELGKNDPSEQLILNTCRTFGVNYDWLKYGKGEMYKERPIYSDGAMALVDEMCRRLKEYKQISPLSVVANVIGVDPINSPRDTKLPSEFVGAAYLLVKVFEEGKYRKIKAIMAQLDAFKPIPKSDEDRKIYEIMMEHEQKEYEKKRKKRGG